MVWKGLWRVHIQYLHLFLRHVRPSPKGQPSHSAEQGTAWIRETQGLLIAGLILGLQCQQRGMNTNINNNLSVKYKSGVLNGFSLRELRRTYTWLGCPNQQSWGQDKFFKILLFCSHQQGPGKLPRSPAQASLWSAPVLGLGPRSDRPPQTQNISKLLNILVSVVLPCVLHQKL